MPVRRPLALALAAVLVVGLAGCAAPKAGTSAAAGDGTYPIRIPNAFGTTVIEKKPVRVATVAWANQEVPLALGIVPVGMAKATWGDDDGDGVLPWVHDRLEQLGAKTPVLFDETDSIDFEAVANTRPDVILAAYSGLSKADYDTLSKIAPVVAYPEHPWTTSLDEMVRLDSEALGLKARGEALAADLKSAIASAAAKQPSLAGKRAMFAYIDPSKLSSIGFYTANDPRVALLPQLGMASPKVVQDASSKAGSYYSEISAEKADELADVDVIVTYGDAALLKAMQANPLLSKIPAVKNGAVVLLTNSTPLAASSNPSPLSIGWGLERYVGLLATAADKAS